MPRRKKPAIGTINGRVTMLSFDSTTRAEYDAATSAAGRAQAVLDALSGTVSVVVYNGSGTVMGSGTMQPPWATRSANVLTFGELASFSVTTSGTPDANWYLQFEGNSRWVRGSFGLTGSGQDFTWSLATWSTAQTGTLGTIIATSSTYTLTQDLTGAYDVAGAVITFGWSVPEGYAISAPSTGGNVDLAQYLNRPQGVTPSYTLTTPITGVSVSSSTGVLIVAPGTAAGVYTATVAADDGTTVAESDWLARSTGAGVVWAHDFRYDAELTQFLWSQGSARENGIKPRLVSDSPNPNGRSIENMVLGGVLATNFGVSDTSAFFVDLTDWPSGDFYFLMGGDPNAGRGYPAISYNRFYVPANNGSTTGRFGNELRGVVFDATNQWTTTSTTRTLWLSGDNGGMDVQQPWVRPFAALSSGNGLPSADINRPGVTPRAWSPLAVTSANATWGYGYYGHQDYHNLTWTAARATAAGSVQHADCWDGDEFYIQARVKIDRRYWDNHIPTDSTQAYWFHKMAMIQTQQSSAQQLAIFPTAHNRYFTPGNPGPSFGWHEHWNNNSRFEINGSYQPGGPWEATAKTTNSPRAATGLTTPNGSSSFFYPPDAWVTLLFRVIPGHDRVGDTFLEVKAALAGQPYYTVWSGYYPLGIGFTQTNDLPGWCAFWIQSYQNLTIAQTNHIARSAYFKRWTQIIFSKQPIAAPAAGA